MVKRRQTKRKSAITDLLEEIEGRPLLLDELRWRVLRADTNSPAKPLTRSFLNSFARTVREQLTHHEVVKLPISETTPVGLLARMALFRVRDPEHVATFLATPDALMECWYTTSVKVETARYMKNRWVTPYHHAVVVALFLSPDPTTSELARVFIPGTQAVSVVAKRGTRPPAESLSHVPWKLCRSQAYGRSPVWTTSPLREIHED